jgi:opine dehydrogenase
MGETIGPTSLKDRYITEDVPCSLVPIALIGEKLGIDVSMTRAVVEIGSAVCAEDYWRTGRTLESLGLDAMTRSEMIETFSRRQ